MTEHDPRVFLGLVFCALLRLVLPVRNLSKFEQLFGEALYWAIGTANASDLVFFLSSFVATIISPVAAVHSSALPPSSLRLYAAYLGNLPVDPF